MEAVVELVSVVVGTFEVVDGSVVVVGDEVAV